MEFFERAHVIRKDSSIRENKSEQAVKKQLKQMLTAYRKGNNKDIKSYAETEHKYDLDDVKSVSEFSETSFLKETQTQDTISSHASQSSTGQNSSSCNEHSFSKSLTQSESSDSLESITEFEEEFKSLPSSRETYSTDKDFSSSYDNSSLMSEDYSKDSDISIPSSLQTSDSESVHSDDGTFDADGTLASKILAKLEKKPKSIEKRKLTKEKIDFESKIPKRGKQKELSKHDIKKFKKDKKKNPACEDLSDKEAFRVLETKDEVDSAYRHIKSEMNEDSVHENNSNDSLSSNNSSAPYISVSATDMLSQSLGDIVGEYVYTTIKNLSSEKHYYYSSNYAVLDEVMTGENLDDVSSIIPEIDEDLALEDLTLETDPQEFEESTVYDDTVQTEDYFEHESSTDDIEDKLVPIKLYNGKNNYILVLKHPAELYVHGKVKVMALGGSVEIFGYTLKDDSVDLFAPYCYSAHSIKTGENVSAFHSLFGRLASAGLTESEAEEIITTISEHDAVICLSKLNSKIIDFVDNNFTATELFSKRGDQTPKLLKKAAENLGCSLYLVPPKRTFDEKSSWDQIVTCGMNNQSRGIICGGKGTGKSTTLRYCVNRLLSKGPVLVIDLDPGQAEFTVPGNVSINIVNTPLIGPNFTHLKKPEKTLNIGMINTMDNPSRYISAVSELIAYCHCNEAYHSLPWIVNTMGMCNHMGLKFMTYIILQIQPTFVYQIDSKITKKRYEFELQSHAIRNLYDEYRHDRLFSNVTDPYNLDYTFIVGMAEESLSPQKPRNNFALSPADERYLNVLAYFGELLNIYGKSILDIVPYEVNIRDLSFGVNVKIPEDALTKVINGKIIALCQLPAADKGKMFTLGDTALLSHGCGLIRGIDFEKGLLYILTPLPIEELNSVNTLVYADWMPELRGQEKELPGGTIVPYRTATAFHQRKLMFPPRRRFNPLQLLKVTRSS